MKKTLFFGAAMATMLWSATFAQDTLHTRVPPSRYFTDNWPVGFYNASDEDTLRCQFYWFSAGYNIAAEAFRKYTKDTITVYGIAASMESKKDHYGEEFRPESYLDTTYEDVYDYLRLFEAGPSQPIPIGEPLKVHMHVTPISYYIDLDIYPVPAWENRKWPVLPMYERYFRTPVKVVDSFYVGRECHACRYAEGYDGTTMPISIAEIFPTTDSVVLFQYSCRKGYARPFGYTGPFDTSFFRWIYDTTHWGWNRYAPMMFPIITPPDTTIVSNDTIIINDTLILCDTLIVGDDTIISYDTILGIDDHGLLGRLTGVMPNPATGKVRVLSSFGLTMVEAFNTAGEKVHELRLPDTPLTATLDVSHWPTGTYILRLHTPQGVATKKLIVK